MTRQERSFEWAVVGMGRAGRIRMRCLNEAVTRGHIHASSRRDHTHHTFADILTNDAIRGVFICRESGTHPDDVRRALHAGKHVLVEYPLAFSREDGECLFDLARKNQCVLHVGFLGLLDGWAGTVNDIIRQHKPSSAVYRFQAGFGGVPQADVANGRLGTMVLARIQQLIAWFGQLQLETYTAAYLDRGVVVEATFRSLTGQLIRFSESRLADQKRIRFLTLKTQSGVLLDVPAWYGDPQVFATDTRCFMDRCFGKARNGSWIDEEAVLHGLSLAEAISKGLNSKDERVGARDV
ncbi:MAG: Gfo/Idh/MocA family oxidoreductase [Myxococcota bacterium]|nr:Gfo/Idh/MocA family oxidoreductase [Myxococcota bacterium]